MVWGLSALEERANGPSDVSKTSLLFPGAGKVSTTFSMCTGKILGADLRGSFKGILKVQMIGAVFGSRF